MGGGMDIKPPRGVGGVGEVGGTTAAAAAIVAEVLSWVWVSVGREHTSQLGSCSPLGIRRDRGQGKG